MIGFFSLTYTCCTISTESKQLPRIVDGFTLLATWCPISTEISFQFSNLEMYHGFFAKNPTSLPSYGLLCDGSLHTFYVTLFRLSHTKFYNPPRNFQHFLAHMYIFRLVCMNQFHCDNMILTVWNLRFIRHNTVLFYFSSFLCIDLPTKVFLIQILVRMLDNPNFR